MIIDTHAHYDDERFDEDRDVLIRSFSENGIEAAVTVCADLKSLTDVPLLVEKYDRLFGAAGLHPDDVGDLNAETEKIIEDLVNRPGFVAVGEIGLDYHWNVEPREVQKDAFRRQIDIAKRAGKPIMVHSRDAAADTMNVIKESDAATAGGIIHCYSGSVEMAREYVDMGFYLGIGGVVTFGNAKTLKEVVRNIPLSSLVLETDCPYLAPVPYRGKRNSSLYLPYVVSAIAELKECSGEEVIETTRNNVKELLGI